MSAQSMYMTSCAELSLACVTEKMDIDVMAKRDDAMDTWGNVTKVVSADQSGRSFG